MHASSCKYLHIYIILVYFYKQMLPFPVSLTILKCQPCIYIISLGKPILSNSLSSFDYYIVKMSTSLFFRNIRLGGRNGTLHFIRFPTTEMQAFVDLAKSKNFPSLARTICATGGGAYKFDDCFMEVIFLFQFLLLKLL